MDARSDARRAAAGAVARGLRRRARCAISRSMEYNASGRVERLRVSGMRPDEVTGPAFRDALGTTRIRSTAFTLARQGNVVRFTGRGYGHGVGMCVIGAGRRARRGESLEAILAQYYPNLQLTDLAGASVTPQGSWCLRRSSRRAASGVLVSVPRDSKVSARDLERLTVDARESLSRVLGTTARPVTVELHESLDQFRLEVRRPWWVSAAVTGTTIDLAPAALLAQREGHRSHRAHGDGGAVDVGDAGRSAGVGARRRRAILLERVASSGTHIQCVLPGRRRADAGALCRRPA